MPKRLHSWQVWHQLKHHLGETMMMNVLGRSNARSIRMYSQDPRFTQDRCKDPLEGIKILLDEAEAIGRGDIRRAAIAYLEGEERGQVTETMPTIEAELLADYQALATLQRAIEACEDVDVVDALVVAAKEEIDRTYAKYLKDCR
jgi:hypothetical protein